MAQRRIVQFVDDLTGRELARGTGESVEFGLDDSIYQIDLSSDGAREFRGLMAPYVAAGRRTGNFGPRVPTRRTTTDVDMRAVRAWAASHGIRLSPRGRVPRNVIDEFRAAGN